MEKENSKSKIDRVRDSAISMEVGNKSDGAITDVVGVADEDLYIVKEHSIYRVLLADRIDPERTNVDIPNSNQRISSAGSKSIIVARSFLTANTLFNSTQFDQSHDQRLIMNISIDFMKELLAAEQYMKSFVSTELAARDGMAEPKDRAFTIPAIDNLVGQIKSYLQKIEHAGQEIYRLTQIFYDHKEKMFTGFATKLETVYGAEDNFVEFAKELARFLQFVRNVRHCVEHPKSNQKLVIEDFKLDVSGQVSVPTIEVIHAETSQPQMAVADFMQQVLECMLSTNETLMIHLSAKHMRENGGFEVAVGIVPTEQRRKDTLVQVGYLINMNGRWHQLG